MAINISDSFNSPWGAGVTPKTVGDLVGLVLNIAFIVSGITILFFIVFAGIKMIQSAGNGNAQDAEKAKQALSSAAIGFAIIFVSYWIVKLIELITGSTFITSPTF